MVKSAINTPLTVPKEYKIKRWIWWLLNKLNQAVVKPRMILGYRRHDGVLLQHTRISSSTLVGSPAALDIADNVFIGHHSILDCSNGVSIEEGCQICAYVNILTHSSHIAIRLYGKHYIEYNGRHHGYVTGSVKIGKYSFIGPHSVIMPGTVLGKGTIVAAYTLVKGQFPDYAFIAGNPARIIGDTRTMDAKLLAQYPELQPFYNEWAQD